MSFFEPVPPPPEPPEPRRRPEWAGPPPDSLGWAVGIGPIVRAETGELVLAVGNFVAYPAGVELDLVVLRRPGAGEGVINPLPMHGPRGSPEEFLRFGVEFADGRKATNVGMRIPRAGAMTSSLSTSFADDEPGQPVLWQRGGGGDGERYTQGFWLWPLPPPGALALVCECPSQDVSESRAEIEAAPILAAAERAQVFWSS